MIDIDSFNPLNRLLLGKINKKKDVDQEVILADPAKDSKDEQINPSRLNLSLLRHLSVTKLLIIPIALSGIYFYFIARDRYVTR